MSISSTIGIAGSVNSLGSSRWSRSVASSSTRTAEYAPKIRAGTGSGKRSVRTPITSAPMTTTTGVRQSIGRMDPSSCSGQRAEIRSATKPQIPPAMARTTASGVTDSESNTAGVYGPVRGPRGPPMVRLPMPPPARARRASRA